MIIDHEQSIMELGNDLLHAFQQLQSLWRHVLLIRVAESKDQGEDARKLQKARVGVE